VIWEGEVPQRFIAADRDQELLMPPALADWLPDDHLAWFIIDAVAALDLGPFVARYRADGRGRAAYDPQAMLALTLYAYCVGERSSRAIERRCAEDVAFRVILANQRPDHATIARFRARHQAELAGLFGQVLSLCADAGMVRVGVVALDGTRMAASAARRANLDRERIEREARRILAEAAEADEREDARYGTARGDELPRGLSRRAGRLERLREAARRLDEREAERLARHEAHLSAGARKSAPAARASGAGGRCARSPTRRPPSTSPTPTAACRRFRGATCRATTASWP
jgi:transposase